MRRTIAAVVGCVGVVAAASAVHAADATGRVPTVTRLVQLFVDREEALSAAMSRGDAAAMADTLADDFELRTATRAAQPVPRAEFIAVAARARPPARPIARMAVHDLGSHAVASFVEGNDARTAVFVVDVWRRQANDWKLAIRYAGPAGTPEFAIPGAGPPEAEIPKR